MASELNSLLKFGTLNNSTSVNSSDDKEKEITAEIYSGGKWLIKNW